MWWRRSAGVIEPGVGCCFAWAGCCSKGLLRIGLAWSSLRSTGAVFLSMWIIFCLRLMTKTCRWGFLLTEPLSPKHKISSGIQPLWMRHFVRSQKKIGIELPCPTDFGLPSLTFTRALSHILPNISVTDFSMPSAFSHILPNINFELNLLKFVNMAFCSILEERELLSHHLLLTSAYLHSITLGIFSLSHPSEQIMSYRD